MSPWLLVLVALLPGGSVIVFVVWLFARYTREDAADYVQQIAVLKSDTPLALPAIKALKAKRVGSGRSGRAVSSTCLEVR